MKQISQKINNTTDMIMDKIADALGFKTTFLIFCIVAIVPLFFQFPSDILQFQSWISQTFIQLVSLSVLAIVSKKEGSKTNQLLNEIHTASMNELQSQDEEFKDIKDMMTMLKDEVVLQKDETQELKDYAIELHTIMSELIEIQNKLNIKQEGEK